MKKQIEAMKLALEALQKIYIAPEHEDYIQVWWPACEQAITALREALAEQPAQQEPVECQYGKGGYACCEGGPCKADEQNNAPKQAQQEPVAVVSGYCGGQCVILPIDPARIFNSNTALYTSPPAQEFVCSTGLCHYRKPLTDEEIERIYTRYGGGMMNCARAIERAHGIKENT